MVSRHAKRGMPTHSVELAEAWCEANLVPSLRKGARNTRLPPAPFAVRAPEAPASLDTLATLLEDAGEWIVASLVFECELELARAYAAVSAIGCALDAWMSLQGMGPTPFWRIQGPELHAPGRLGDSPAAQRIRARVAELRAACGE